MSAATADRATTSRAGSTRYLSLATAAVIFAGCLVAINASGEAIDGAPGADVQFAGVARQAADEAAGDVGVNVHVDGEFLLSGAGWAAGDEGADCYLLDNQTVVPAGHAGMTHWVKVGKVVQVVSATSVWVRIEPLVPQAPRLFSGPVTGTNAAALDLDALAARYGGTGIYVTDVLGVAAFVTATKAEAGLKVAATNYTLAGGVITCVTNESANTWLIHILGVLQ